MGAWNKTSKASQSCGCWPGFSDSNPLFFHSLCYNLLGSQDLHCAMKAEPLGRHDARGACPPMGTLGDEKVPMEPVKGSAWQIVSHTANTVRYTALLISKAVEGWQAEREVKWQLALLSCLVINVWTRTEALNFGSDLSIKSRGLAFQLK